MKDKGQKKMHKGKENTPVLFRGLFCRFNECKDNPQTQVNYKLHNKFSKLNITQYIYSYHFRIYQYFYRTSYKPLPTGINYRKKHHELLANIFIKMSCSNLCY